VNIEYKEDPHYVCTHIRIEYIFDSTIDEHYLFYTNNLLAGDEHYLCVNRIQD
jgi:hypothetical protein